jgi:hypothetical protein
MAPSLARRNHPWIGLTLASTMLWVGCGDDGTGPGERTGATLRGQIVQFGAQDNADEASFQVLEAGPGLKRAFAPVSGVTVTVGDKSDVTDEDGNFSVTDIPLEDPTAVFSGSGIQAPYTVTGLEENATVQLNGVQVVNGSVTTEHTGIWVGTAGSSDPGSAGQIAFTLIISANGNALTGTGSVVPPDASVWTMSGFETGTTVDGTMTLVSSNSSCATGGNFTGTFSADTLSGTFIEVNPPAGCGSPESGTFRVVKQ